MSTWPATVQYDPGVHAGARIYGHSNPWLRDSELRDVDLYDLESKGLIPLEQRPDTEDACDTCLPGWMRGVIPAMDTEFGIQRCDYCAIFEGDLEAAQALAGFLQRTLELDQPYTVWFEMEMTDGT